MIEWVVWSGRKPGRERNRTWFRRTDIVTTIRWSRTKAHVVLFLHEPSGSQPVAGSVFFWSFSRNSPLHKSLELYLENDANAQKGAKGLEWSIPHHSTIIDFVLASAKSDWPAWGAYMLVSTLVLNLNCDMLQTKNQTPSQNISKNHSPQDKDPSYFVGAFFCVLDSHPGTVGYNIQPHSCVRNVTQKMQRQEPRPWFRSQWAHHLGDRLVGLVGAVSCPERLRMLDIIGYCWIEHIWTGEWTWSINSWLWYPKLM